MYPLYTKPNMDVEKCFHMTGGDGDTSYAKNSSLQKAASDTVKHITIEALQEMYVALEAPKSLGIADLGCSTGPNSLSIIKDFVEAVEAAAAASTCKIMTTTPPPPPPPTAPDEFRVYLNDLPTNDFNSVFKSLPDFYRARKEERSNNNRCPLIFIGGYPGSFYGRLFPNTTLHFVFSSYSLHWLSKVPPALYDEQGKSINKGNIYISESSPPLVSQAYYAQFQEDFSSFLHSRSEELTAGGRMVLILCGRIGQDHADRGNSFLWKLLSRSLAILVSQGKINKEALDSYDANFYAPSKDEIETQIKREGSFELDRLEVFGTHKELAKLGENYGKEIARSVRSIQESMLSNHFGEGILDALFEVYGGLLDQEILREEINPIALVLVLTRLKQYSS